MAQSVNHPGSDGRLRIFAIAVCLLTAYMPSSSAASGISPLLAQGNAGVGRTTLGSGTGATPTSSARGAPPEHNAAPVTGSELEQNPSLEAVERYAREHNPAIRAASEAWNAVQKEVVIRRSYENPMVMYMPDTNNMAQTRAGSQTTGVAVSQAIPFPGKLTLRGRIAAHESDAARANLRAVVQEIERRVWVSYASYYLADRALEVNDETTQLARQFEAIAEAKYKVGKVPEQDVIQSQGEISQLAVQRVDLVKAHNTALGALNTLLDRGPRAVVGRPADLAAKALAAPLERLVEDSVVARPELNAQRSLVKARETSVTLARMGYLPDFSVDNTSASPTTGCRDS
jgi:cobalt-zinc-cadmium efflux system outer membrane protein